MLAATTSARIRSASMALPEVSINSNRFIDQPPGLRLLWFFLLSLLFLFPTP
jgi:hypothetical protein